MPLEDLEQVEAEAGAQRSDELPRRGREGGVLELPDHPPAAEEAEVAPLRPGAGVVGVLPRDRGEVGAALNPGAKRLDLGPGLGLGPLGADLDEDVAGVHLLGALVVARVLFVEALQIGRVELDLGAQTAAVDEQVGDHPLTRQAEILPVRGVVGLDPGGIDGGLLGEPGGRELEVADPGPLRLLAVGALDLGIRHVERLGEDARDLVDEDLVADHLLERRHRVALVGDHLLVILLTDEVAALVAEDRLGEDRLPHLRVARREAEPLGLAQQDLLAHELLERLERELELLGHLGSEPLAERLAVPLFEVAVLALVLVVADATVAHGGRRPAAAPAETGAAEVDEDEGDEDDDDEPENPGEVTQVVTQDLEHGRLPRPGEPGTNAAC